MVQRPKTLQQRKRRKLLYALRLRKRMTLAEKILWKELRERRLPYKLRRQVPIGIYIVDFLCVECRLAIEVDGPIHEMQREYDVEREDVLRQKGYRILRFTNDNVINDRLKTLALIEHAMRSALEGSSAMQ